MHATYARLLHVFRPRSPKPGTYYTLIETRPPLFQRVPPWWARWSLGLIACDIFMTGSVIELTWNHWSTLVSDLENASVKSRDVSLSSSTPNDYSLRPNWQRLALCIAHLGFGAALAAALLVAQTRFVRTFAILPPVRNNSSAEGRRVFIQCAHNFRKNGTVFPLNKCSLQEGRDHTEMIFRVAGKRGHWYIGLNDAVIHGRRSSVDNARAAILADWGGKRVGKWTSTVATDNRWKSGPVRRKVD